jgi:hypothetical protein
MVTERSIIKKRSPSPPAGPVPIPYPNTSAVDEAQTDDTAAPAEKSRSDAEVTERGLLPDMPNVSLPAPLVSQVQYPSAAQAPNCFKVVNNLRFKELVFADRNDIYTTIPQFVAGATFIRPCIGPLQGVSTTNYPVYATFPESVADFLRFEISQPVTVYVGLPGFVSKPRWLDSFVDTGVSIGINGHSSRRSLKLFSKSYPAGSVILGGNGATNSLLGIYTAIVVPSASSPQPPLSTSTAPTSPRSSLMSNVRLWGSQEPSPGCFRVMENLRYEELVYADRDDRYMNPPPIVSGATYIRPCIGPAEGAIGGYPRYALTEATTNPFLSFVVSRQVTVYVAMPPSVSKPEWLNTFSDTGTLVSILTANTNRRFLKLFAKNYAAGAVVLGGNGANNTAQGIYSVMVIPGWNPKLPAPKPTPLTR